MAKDIPAHVRRIVAERAIPDWMDGPYPLCEANTIMCSGEGAHWHHRKMRSQGGPHAPSNGLMVCGDCHDWIHGHPELSYSKGWLVRGCDDHEREPVSRWGEFVLLQDDGSVTPEIEWFNTQNERFEE